MKAGEKTPQPTKELASDYVTALSSGATKLRFSIPEEMIVIARVALILIVGLLVCSASSLAQTEATLKAEVQVCISIVDRSPEGAGTTFSGARSVWCWSKITGAEGGQTTVTHVWLYEGAEMARVELPVRSSSWRTWSQKNPYGKEGNWEVQVLDASGNQLGSVKFTVTK